jgi:hypothetical protein
VTTPAAIGLAIALGAVAGLVYTLSPLTVLCGLALIAIIGWGSRGLTPRERRWFLTLVIVAIVARVILVAGLFMAADPDKPFATFFGDEELFKNRSIWLRNLSLELPMSPADLIYALEETGRSSYQYLLAIVQALVGNAPYGVQVLNATLFVTSVIALYRVVRPVFGGLAAMAGLALLLYLPSLFVWSASALKEPLYIFVAVAELVCVLYVARGARWWHRVAAILGVLVTAVALESVRKGGAAVALVGSVSGLAMAFAMTRPRVLVASLVACPIVLAVALSSPRVQDQLHLRATQGAIYHAGHLATPGYSYQLLDPRYYENRILLMQTFTRREAADFTVRALVSYVAEPLPWKGDSGFLRAYLPEQIVWWVLVALLPFGIIAGLRIDPVLTMILCAHGAMIALVVALTSGNAGTLVRHRGLVLPYMVWLSTFGAVAIARWMTPLLMTPPTAQRAHGDR